MENNNKQDLEAAKNKAQTDAMSKIKDKECDFGAIQFNKVPEPVVAAHMPMQED